MPPIPPRSDLRTATPASQIVVGSFILLPAVCRAWVLVLVLRLSPRGCWCCVCRAWVLVLVLCLSPRGCWCWAQASGVHGPVTAALSAEPAVLYMLCGSPRKTAHGYGTGSCTVSCESASFVRCSTSTQFRRQESASRCQEAPCDENKSLSKRVVM